MNLVSLALLKVLLNDTGIGGGVGGSGSGEEGGCKVKHRSPSALALSVRHLGGLLSPDHRHLLYSHGWWWACGGDLGGEVRHPGPCDGIVTSQNT